jgi:hypothetical protein
LSADEVRSVPRGRDNHGDLSSAVGEIEGGSPRSRPSWQRSPHSWPSVSGCWFRRTSTAARRTGSSTAGVAGLCARAEACASGDVRWPSRGELRQRRTTHAAALRD